MQVQHDNLYDDSASDEEDLFEVFVDPDGMQVQQDNLYDDSASDEDDTEDLYEVFVDPDSMQVQQDWSQHLYGYASDHTVASDEGDTEDLTACTFSSDPTDQPSTSKNTRERPLGKTAREKTSQASITSILNEDCCQKSCLKQFNYNEAETCRRAFWIEKTQSQARDHILTSFRLGDNSAEGASHPKFNLCGKSVCHKAWISLNGISTSRYHSYLRQYKKGALQNPEHRRQNNIYPSERSLCAQVWLEDLARRDGDKMPDAEKILLPASWTVNDVFLYYQEENKDEPVKPLKRTQFLKVWRKHCSHIKIPKFSRFAKCTVCDNLKKALLQATTKIKREEVRDARSAHILLQKLQRMKYYKHSRKARTKPSQYMSIIIDGMDQDDHRLWRLHTQVTGALSHGERKCFARVDHMEYPHDTNLTLNFLTDILVEAAEERDGSLPPVLYIQMDNKAGECKNRWILAYCCVLVKLNVVRKVKVSYLMVGHTHEDIDQLFSRIGEHLRRRSAPTMDQLLVEVEESYTPRPKVTVLDPQNMYDIKQWLDQEMVDIEHHNAPHTFKIIKKEGDVALEFKMWSSDKDWQKLTPKRGGNEKAVLNRVPLGQPQLLQPIPYANPQTLTATIRKLAEVGKLTPEEKSWWTKYITDIANPCLLTDVQHQWGLLTLKEYDATGSDGDEDELLPLQDTINDMLAKQYKQPEVFIGSKEAYQRRKSTVERSTAKKRRGGGATPTSTQSRPEATSASTRGRATQQRGATSTSTRGRATQQRGATSTSTRGRATQQRGATSTSTRGRATQQRGATSTSTRGRATQQRGATSTSTRGRATQQRGATSTSTRGRATQQRGATSTSTRGRATQQRGATSTSTRGRATQQRGATSTSTRGRATQQRGATSTSTRGRATQQRGATSTSTRGRATQQRGATSTSTRGRATQQRGATSTSTRGRATQQRGATSTSTRGRATQQRGATSTSTRGRATQQRGATSTSTRGRATQQRGATSTLT
ncbi:uncharacterized protein [Branchiostoma lanceolatum]|uniref:uncharacterized protein n=1 Tax=Branchiostoma lanceolatum TaxID=7740 RepID=UPI0034520ADE